MEILNIIENDDGSATMDCEFQDDEVQVLLNYAVSNILREQLEALKKEASINE
jgi:hypothetical protein